MNIFQTHKSIEYVKNKPQLYEAIKSWYKYKNKGYNYFFYNNSDRDRFMQQKAVLINNKIWEAYNKLPIQVMKADLWRYCIVYMYGGIYADCDTICLKNPVIFNTNALLTIVPENDTHLCQWVFSAPSKSPILKTIIDESVERILSTEDFTKQHIIHYLTGPGLFTNGIEKYLKENGLPVFDKKKKYYNYSKNELKVFDYNIFHKKIVMHLFFGQKQDGWFKDRKKFLDKNKL